MSTVKFISDIEEKEVVSIFKGELLLTKLEGSIIMVTKESINLMSIDIKDENHSTTPSSIKEIHRFISGLNRRGMNFAQMLLIELVQKDLIPEELQNTEMVPLKMEEVI